jgi:opacity protein-like surface antigen
MKKILNIIICAAMLPSSAIAVEKLDTYLSAEGGMATYRKFNQEDYGESKAKNSSIFGVGIGKNFHKALAVETNLHRFHGIKLDKTNSNGSYKQKLSGTNLGVNFKLLANGIHANFKPYVNAGVGVAWIDSNKLTHIGAPNTVTIEGKVRCNLSYNVGVGFITPISNGVAIKAGYQFFDLGKNGSGEVATVNGATIVPIDEASTRIRAHTGLVGLQYSF